MRSRIDGLELRPLAKVSRGLTGPAAAERIGVDAEGHWDCFARDWAIAPSHPARGDKSRPSANEEDGERSVRSRGRGRERKPPEAAVHEGDREAEPESHG